MTTQPSGLLGEIRPCLAAIDWFTGKPLGEVMTLATQQYPFDLQPELLKKFSDDYFRRHAAQDVGDHVLGNRRLATFRPFMGNSSSAYSMAPRWIGKI